jgi:hypothetical protein
MSSIYSIVHLKPIVEDARMLHTVASTLYRQFASIPISNTDQYVSFYTNPGQYFTPSEFSETQYLFVGDYDARIALILEEIEQVQSVSKISKKSTEELMEYFGYDIVLKWEPYFRYAKKHKNRRVRFVPYQILPDDSIQLIYNIINAAIPNTTFEQLYTFIDRGESWATTHVSDEDIQHSVLLSMNQYVNRMKGKGRKISLDVMQLSNDDVFEIMRFWGIPRKTILSYPQFASELQNGKTWSYQELVELVQTPVLMSLLRLRMRISPLSHQWSVYHRTIPYMSVPSPLMYNALEGADDSDLFEFLRKYHEESVVDTKYEFRLNQKGYVSVLRDLLPRHTEESLSKQCDVACRTIYMYSLADIPGTRTIDVEAETTWIRKFFPQWNSNAPSQLTKEERTELKESLETYNAISTSAERASIYESERKSDDSDDVVRVRDSTFSYVELQYKLYMQSDEYDLLALFNQYPLSVEYPFITLRDPATKENVYKVFKEIAQASSVDVEPYVSRREMERWFQYTNYVYENMRVREIRDIVRGIHCKVMWYVGHLETFERRGTIQSIDRKAHTCVVFGNNKYYRDVPMTSGFIVKKYEGDVGSDLPDTPSVRGLKVGNDVSFYIPHRKYIDIDLDTRGIIHIRAPVTDNQYQTQNITSLTEDIIKVGRRWIQLLYGLRSPPATQIWRYNALEEYNAMQIRQNGMWISPIQSPVMMMNSAYQIRIAIPKKYPIVYHSFISVLKQLYSYFVVNETAMVVGETVEFFDSDIERWISVKVTSYDFETDNYTVEETVARNPRRYTDIRRNYLRFSKETKQSSYIHFTYRKVSDFSLLTPIQQCILRMNQVGATLQAQYGGGRDDEDFKSALYDSDLDGDVEIESAEFEDESIERPREEKGKGSDKGSDKDKKKANTQKAPLTKEDEIIAQIMSQFNLTKNKAIDAYEANKNTAKIAYVHRETGTDIHFDYIQPSEVDNDHIYTFFVHNSHSTDEVYMIRTLLVHLLNLYISYTYPRATISEEVENTIQPIKKYWKTATKARGKSAAEKELEAEITEMIEERAGAFLGNTVEDIGVRIETRADEFDEVDLESLLMANDAFGTSDESSDLETMIDEEIQGMSDSDDELMEEQRRELQYGEAVAEEKKAQEREEDIVAKEGVKQKKMGVKKATTVSTILQRLYDADSSLFAWEQPNKKDDEQKEEPSTSLKKKGRATQQKNYARTCQSIDRQPKVLTDEEFKKQNLSTFSVKMRRENDDGSVTEIEPKVCDMTDPAFRKYVEDTQKEKAKPRKKKKDVDGEEESRVLCSAIKWGSTAENQNWYICPRIFDTKKQVALTTDDIEYQKGDFKPMKPGDAKTEEDKVNAWRTDSTGKDIMEFKPRTKDTHYEPLTTENSESARPIDALFIQNSKKSMKSYVYPGFMDAKNHWQNVYSPCCYESTSARAIDAFTKTSAVAQKQTEYFLQWGKQLEMGRYGYMAEELLEKLGIDNPCKKTTKYDCVMRLHMGTDSYSFIRMMAHICGMYPAGAMSVKDDRTRIDKFLSAVIATISNDQFTRLNRGQLKHEFAMGGNIFELQNFVEYLIADTPHKLSHLYDLFTSPDVLPPIELANKQKDMSPTYGIRLLVIEYQFHPKSKTYSYRMVVPYYRSVQDEEVKKKQHYVIALKQHDKEHYEILEYNQSPFVDEWANVNTDILEYHIKQMEFLIERSTKPFYQTQIPMSEEWLDMMQEAREKSNIFTIHDVREALLNIGDGIAKCVYDNHKIIGVYSVEQKIMIPVYPVELSADIDACPIKDRVTLEELYSNAGTMLLGFNEYWELAREICKKAKPKKRIDIRHLYRLPTSTDSDMKVSGFMCQYGVYVPLKPTEFSALPKDIQETIPWKTDAMNADMMIRKTTEETFARRLYGDRNSIDTIEWCVRNDHMVIETVVTDHLTPTKKEQIIGFVLENGIYIPLRYYDPRVKYLKEYRDQASQSDESIVYLDECKWLDDYDVDIETIEYTDDKKAEKASKLVGVWEIDDDIDTYMAQVDSYYTYLNEHVDMTKMPIYFRPMRIFSNLKDDLLIVTGLLLQTGDRILVKKDNFINLSNNKVEYIQFIRDFYQKPVIHKLLMDKWVVINSSNIWIPEDKRILSNKQFQYHQELYDKIIERLNQFLKEPAQRELREWLISFFDDNSISTERKMRLIRPLYVAMMQSCIKFSKEITKWDIPGYMPHYKIYIWNIYFNAWGMDITWREIWTKQFGLTGEDFEKSTKVQRAVKIFNLYKEHFETDVASDIEIIEGLLKYYIPWAKVRKSNDDAYDRIFVDTRYIRSEEVLEKIYNDLVKNNVVRDMILYEFSASSRVGRYHHDSSTELLVTEHDKWVAQVLDMYKTASRTYYRQLRTLNEIDYDSIMTIDINESGNLEKNNLYKKIKK